MNQLKESYDHAVKMGAIRVPVFVDGAMREAIEEHDRVKAELMELRLAASKMAIEAGIIARPVTKTEADETVLGVGLFTELLSESELRFRRLSVKYEKLRAASFEVRDSVHSVSASADAMKQLHEVLSSEWA
jgi:hypothetical protein